MLLLVIRNGNVNKRFLFREVVIFIMKNIKNIIFWVIIVLLILFAFWGFMNRQKFSDLFSKITAKKTVYEQNSDNDFPKTKIDIPKHEGYLVAIYKDEHRLKLYNNNEIVKEYEINVKREREDREVWSDNQTPEGIFKIETMDEVTNGWSRWMRLDTSEKAKQDYIDNHGDGGRGRIYIFENTHGEINSDEQIRKFNKLNIDRMMLRGIGIHGGGFLLYDEWTEGCMAMDDEDVIELFDILKQSENGGIDTPVIIQD